MNFDWSVTRSPVFLKSLRIRSEADRDDAIQDAALKLHSKQKSVQLSVQLLRATILNAHKDRVKADRRRASRQQRRLMLAVIRKWSRPCNIGGQFTGCVPQLSFAPTPMQRILSEARNEQRSSVRFDPLSYREIIAVHCGPGFATARNSSPNYAGSHWSRCAFGRSAQETLYVLTLSKRASDRIETKFSSASSWWARNLTPVDFRLG